MEASKSVAETTTVQSGRWHYNLTHPTPTHQIFAMNFWSRFIASLRLFMLVA